MRFQFKDCLIRLHHNNKKINGGIVMKKIVALICVISLLFTMSMSSVFVSSANSYTNSSTYSNGFSTTIEGDVYSGNNIILDLNNLAGETINSIVWYYCDAAGNLDFSNYIGIGANLQVPNSITAGRYVRAVIYCASGNNYSSSNWENVIAVGIDFSATIVSNIFSGNIVTLNLNNLSGETVNSIVWYYCDASGNIDFSNYIGVNVTMQVPSNVTVGRYVRAVIYCASGNAHSSDNWEVVTAGSANLSATVSYSTTNLTNGSVIATITPSEGVTVTNNGGSTSYTFASNGTFIFNFRDAAGNTGSATATVTNIDKTAPTATVSYSTTDPTNGTVIATITPSENVTVTSVGASLTHTFNANGDYTFTFVDAAGNTGSITATVSNITSSNSNVFSTTIEGDVYHGNVIKLVLNNLANETIKSIVWYYSDAAGNIDFSSIMGQDAIIQVPNGITVGRYLRAVIYCQSGNNYASDNTAQITATGTPSGFTLPVDNNPPPTNTFSATIVGDIFPGNTVTLNLNDLSGESVSAITWYYCDAAGNLDFSNYIGVDVTILVPSGVTVGRYVRAVIYCESGNAYVSDNVVEVTATGTTDNPPPIINNEIYVSPNGSNESQNDGTKQKPYKTISKAMSLASPGITIILEDGTYTVQTILSKSGTAVQPIIIQAEHYHGAIFTGSAGMFTASSLSIQYIKLSGLWFEDCPLVNNNMYISQVINPGNNWTIEDCRFTRVGTGVHVEANDTIRRCVFENIGVTAMWSYTDANNTQNSILIEDTILRRCNTVNQDPGYGAQGAKFAFTTDLVANGVIGYDNNGMSLWFDGTNKNFLVKNSSFFGDHAGMAYANFTDNVLNDQSWAGIGVASEINPSGSFLNNYIYNNLSSGIAVWESGSAGGINIEGNTLFNNLNEIIFRALNRTSAPTLANVTVKNNFMGNWRNYAWTTTDGMMATTDNSPSDSGFSFSGNDYYGSGLGIGKWGNVIATSVSGLNNDFGLDNNSNSNAFTFDAGTYNIRSTTLDDVGKASMWQVPSGTAESNDFDNVIQGHSTGDIVSLHVTGYTPFVQSGSNWTTSIYDLQARYITLTATTAQMEWIKANVRPYASIMQTTVKVQLSSVSEYTITANAVDQ
jgi:hypothetical protein